jgi:hypothetical protein
MARSNWSVETGVSAAPAPYRASISGFTLIASSAWVLPPPRFSALWKTQGENSPAPLQVFGNYSGIPFRSMKVQISPGDPQILAEWCRNGRSSKQGVRLFPVRANVGCAEASTDVQSKTMEWVIVMGGCLLGCAIVGFIAREKRLRGSKKIIERHRDG